MIATERSTNITVIIVITCIIAIYIVPTETAACRTDYTQKLFLAEMVPVRGSFSYNKKLSKHQV